MFLVGNHQHALDDKNRIRLPAKFREQLGNNYVIMPGMGGCMFVYAAEKAQRLFEELGTNDSFEPEVAEYVRSITEFSALVEADSQGRFMLPDDLINICGINKNVRIVGAIGKVEIWSEERYVARRNGQDHTPEAFDKLYKSLHKAMETK